jgi:hypothetical protein
MFADLVGMPYRWGHSPEDGSGFTDCFGLACTMRRRLELSDYYPRFAWVYAEHTETSLPPGRILRWVLEHSAPCPPRPGAIAVLPARCGALATCTDSGIICIGPGQNVIHVPLPPRTYRTYWLRE